MHAAVIGQPTRRIAIAPLSGALRIRVDALRWRWDPGMAERIESHVTLLYASPPFARVHAVTRSLPRLRVRPTRAVRWEAEPGIALAVEDPHGDLRRYRAALGEVEPGYAPHITLLHRDSVTRPQQVEDAWEALRGLVVDEDVAIDEVVVYEELAGGWRTAGRTSFQRDA